MSDENRTEQPTGKRRKEARDRGQIARSRDLSLALASLAVTGGIGLFGPMMLRRMAAVVAHGLTAAGHIDHDLAIEDVMGLVLANMATLALVVAPIAAVAAGVAIASGAAQGGLHIATTALHINFGR